MSANNNLHKAKKEKNDEFYTQLSDIEREIKYYKSYFKDKVVFLNCDDHKWSNFYRYFTSKFEYLGLKKLITTHYQDDGISYKMVVEKDENGDGKIDALDIVETPLKQNGDFRSPESVALLEEADIVVTNPPFSLFREYIAQLMEYDKKFLIVGSMNAITYKEIFPFIKNEELWLGNNLVKEFKQPDGSIKKFGNINWYTNLDHKKRHEKFIPFKTYKDNKEDYLKYDNYDAINIDKAVEIPNDYDGVMGVPISFLSKLSPDQFEIIGQMANTTMDSVNKGYPFIDSKRKYARILIKWKKDE